MPANLSPSGPVDSYSTSTQFVPVWFAANAALSPTSFGGPFVTTVARTGVGLYTITLTGFAPRALLSVSAYAFDNANPDDTTASTGAVTLTAASKTVTVRVATRTAAGVAKDIAANAASLVKVGLHFKVHAGRDATGL